MVRQNTGDFENYGFELSAKYFLNPFWRFSANYSYLNMNKPVTGAPENKICLSADYASDRLSSGVSLQQVSGLYILTGDNPEKESYTLLNAVCSYKVLDFMTVFVKGENLLAQEYQTYSGFYMPKATFTGGVKFNFDSLRPRNRSNR